MKGVLILLLIGWTMAAYAPILQRVGLSPEEARLIMREIPRSHPRVDVYVVTDLESVKPGGRVKVGVLFEIAEGWNIYDYTPGAGGYIPTTLEWKLPEGCVLEQLSWQQPEQLYPEVATQGYRKNCFVVATIRTDKTVRDNLSVLIEGQWQVCNDMHCLRQEDRMTVEVKVGKKRKRGSVYGVINKW